MKEFYNTEDIMRITGYKKTKSRDIIVKLKEELIKEYPNAIAIGCLIPKWYFNEKVLGKVERSEEYEK